MAELENILIKSPANFSSMSNGEMITQVHGDNVISFLKSDNNIYSLKWQKHSESNESVSKSYIGSGNYKSGSTGWRINDNGQAEFENVESRVAVSSLSWDFFTGTSASKNEMVTIHHGVNSGKKRIVCVSVNMISDTSPSLASGSIPTGSFIAGAGNIQDELDEDREFRTFYDDDNLYIITDSTGDDVTGNQFTCAVFYLDYDLY
jgi:hypothetical protein